MFRTHLILIVTREDEIVQVETPNVLGLCEAIALETEEDELWNHLLADLKWLMWNNQNLLVSFESNDLSSIRRKSEEKPFTIGFLPYLAFTERH